MNTFFDPSRRWRELRAVAESMQSDVFLFRTRTGPYKVDRATPRAAEQSFSGRVQAARVEVMQVAALAESSFNSMYKNHVYRHGQNANSATDAFNLEKLSEDAPLSIQKQNTRDGHIVDNHHSPMCGVAPSLFYVAVSTRIVRIHNGRGFVAVPYILLLFSLMDHLPCTRRKPSQYVDARLVPLLNYYQGCIPRKYREHKVTVFLLLATTCAVTVLSYLAGRLDTTVDLAAVAGIVAGASAGITAWQSESGANRKINRYSIAVVELKNLILWWDSLTPVDQNSQRNINHLVSTGEGIKLSEVIAWADASRRRDHTAAVQSDEGEEQTTQNPLFNAEV